MTEKPKKKKPAPKKKPVVKPVENDPIPEAESIELEEPCITCKTTEPKKQVMTRDSIKLRRKERIEKAQKDRRFKK